MQSDWIPVFTGMTTAFAGMTGFVGMTEGDKLDTRFHGHDRLCGHDRGETNEIPAFAGMTYWRGVK